MKQAVNCETSTCFRKWTWNCFPMVPGSFCSTMRRNSICISQAKEVAGRNRNAGEWQDAQYGAGTATGLVLAQQNRTTWYLSSHVCRWEYVLTLYKPKKDFKYSWNPFAGELFVVQHLPWRKIGVQMFSGQRHSLNPRVVPLICLKNFSFYHFIKLCNFSDTVKYFTQFKQSVPHELVLTLTR